MEVNVEILKKYEDEILLWIKNPCFNLWMVGESEEDVDGLMDIYNVIQKTGAISIQQIIFFSGLIGLKR